MHERCFMWLVYIGSSVLFAVLTALYVWRFKRVWLSVLVCMGIASVLLAPWILEGTQGVIVPAIAMAGLNLLSYGFEHAQGMLLYVFCWLVGALIVGVAMLYWVRRMRL